ncbi:MAG: anti-sigma factor antagonist [Acidobacteriaceae bacterium]|nr:anti-sigma factor antagonist [Acidobacteriaceae bacterium]
MQTETKTSVDQISGESGGRITVLRFSGDISSNSHDALLGTYTTVSKSQPVLLDFSKVEYINSSGIALVIQMLMEANKNGQKIAAFGLTPHFQKVFTMVGITKYACLYQDEAAARASI